MRTSMSRRKGRKVSFFFYIINVFSYLEDESPIRGATFLARDLYETWNAMSQEERVEAMKDAINRLQEQREGKALTVQNLPINCFHDARATLKSIELQVSSHQLVTYHINILSRSKNSMLVLALRSCCLPLELVMIITLNLTY